MRCGWMWVFLTGLLLAGGPARATRFTVLTVEQLAGNADLIVHGTVVSVEVRRDGKGRVFTAVDLRLAGVWKGAVDGPVCRVVAAGGTLGEEQVAVGGQPEYRVGDELVVFLVRNPAGEWVTLGLAHGHFRVDRGTSSEGATADPGVHNFFWGEPGDRGTAGGLRFPAQRRMSLTQLRSRVEEVVR